MFASQTRLRQRGVKSSLFRRTALLLEPLENRLAPALGLVADYGTNSVTTFDPDTNAALGSASLPTFGTVGDAAITADGQLGFATDFSNQVWVVDLANPAAPAVEPTPIAISNPGEDIAITPDQNYLLVSDGGDFAPLSVVDIPSRTEISTFDLGSDANSVDVSETGSVLVTSFNFSSVRRLTIDGSGTLTDTGESLFIDSPINVYAAPGGTWGIAVSYFSAYVQSFAIAGLTPVDSSSLSGSGIAAVFNPAGDRVYVRGDAGFIDAFTFDPATGELGDAPLFSIPVSSAISFFGMDQLAISADGAKLYVPSFDSGAIDVYDAANGAYLASITDPNISAPTGIAIPSGFSVTGSDPANGAVVSSQPTDFVIHFSADYDPASVAAGDLTVNGITPTSVDQTDADTLTFHYAVSPVTSQGLQTMHMDEGAVTSLENGEAVNEFNATFRYDIVLLQVISTDPADGSTITLPANTLDLNFNEPYDFASAQPSDFAVNQGSVSGVSPIDADTLRLTLSGVVAEGTLTVSMNAGAMTDVYGNPGAAFSGSYTLDFGTFPYPTPLQPAAPAGSLIYQGSQVGIISPDGDSDSFSILVDPGQKITLTVDPADTLQPIVELYRVDDTGNLLIGSAMAGSPGLEAVLQTVAGHGQIGVMGPGPKTYLVTVRGADGSTGAYSVQMILNAAVENENHGGAANNTLAAAQSLESAFLSFNASVTSSQSAAYPGRGAVLGRHDDFNVSTVYSVDFESEDHGFTVDNTPPDPFYLEGLWHYSIGRGMQPGHTANHSFYYGAGEDADGGGSINIGVSFFSPNPTTGRLISPSLELPVDGILLVDFNYVLETRFFPDFPDIASLQINDGSGWTTLQRFDRVAESLSWRNSDPVDLTAYAGQTIQLGWSFDTVLGPVGRFPEGWYVDDVRIRQFIPVADYFSFQLGAGESATLALTGLSPGGLALSLEDGSGTTLATGSADATNVESVVSEYVAAQAGTYYARVVGRNLDGTNYSLLVTRNAEFDTEGNDTLATAQELLSTQVAGKQWALGNVSGDASVLDLRGTPVTGALILAGDKITLGIQSDGSFIVGPTGIQFLGNEFVEPGTPLAGFTIGRDGANFTNKGAIGITDIAVTLEDLSMGSFHGVRAVGIVGGNLQLERVVAFRDGDEFVTVATRLTNFGGTTLANVAWLENLDPDQGEPLGQGFETFNDVVLGGELVRGDAVTPAFPDGLTIGLGSSDSRRVVSAEGFDNNDPFAIIDSPEDPDGAFDDIAINMAFNYGSLAPSQAVSSVGVMTFGRSTTEADATYVAHSGGVVLKDFDVYRITVDALRTLEVQTITPARKNGESVNNLDPMIRVYNAAGVVVASDDNSDPDGRNAKVSYKVPKGGGVYYIEVLPSSATPTQTSGEYILTVKANTGGKSLYFDGDPVAGAASTLSNAALQRAVAHAIDYWRSEGADTRALSSIRVQTADLADAMLGHAFEGAIVIDVNAAGHGWSLGQGGAAGAVGLYATVAHELGHALGFEHADASAVMRPTLGSISASHPPAPNISLPIGDHNPTAFSSTTSIPLRATQRQPADVATIATAPAVSLRNTWKTMPIMPQDSAHRSESDARLEPIPAAAEASVQQVFADLQEPQAPHPFDNQSRDWSLVIPDESIRTPGPIMEEGQPWRDVRLVDEYFSTLGDEAPTALSAVATGNGGHAAALAGLALFLGIHLGAGKKPGAGRRQWIPGRRQGS